MTDHRSVPAAIAQAKDRAKKLVPLLTLEEKLRLVHGTGRPSRTEPNGTGGHIAGVPRLGIPNLVMADGPNGVGNGSTGTTAFPAAVSLAASWDTELSHRVGEAIADEHLSKGNGVALTPTVNILRIPHWGRSFETMGEDPHLASEMAVAQINGVQSRGVIATVKHLAVNNQEKDRWSVDAHISERALREIYLPAFEAAVQAGVLAVMAAYNKVNGHFATENHHLLTEILRDDWGFEGLTMSDWAATRSTVPAALSGLDVEMPYGPVPQYPVFYGPELEVAVRNGEVPEDRIDLMVTRILTAMAAAGLLDEERTGSQTNVATTPSHQALAREAVAAGTVLLKNDNQVLPFESGITTLAVIGVAADSAPIITGGGSALVRPDTTKTPLEGIRERAAGISIKFAPGTAGTGMLPGIPPALLRSRTGLNGWDAAYFHAGEPENPAVQVFEADIDSTLSEGLPLPGEWTAKWSTTLTPENDGTHRVSLDASGFATLKIGDSLAIENDGRDLSAITHATVDLKAGEPVRLELDYRAELLEKRTPRIRVGLLAPNEQLLLDARMTAAEADAVVVVVNDLRTEGGDVATLALPGDQDDLIRAVAAENPRTIVVLHTAGPVLMPWLDDVAAVVESWYPGQESGAGLADVLFGDVNPSGRLPMTFPASDTEHPAGTDPLHYPGLDGVVKYEEELLVGYRWWRQTATRPLFPFGHGLSYTSFEYEDLELSRDGDDLIASWRLTNSGDRPGREIAQLYLGYPAEAGEPPLQLRAFRNVQLAPGETTSVSVTLPPAARRLWDTTANGWSVLPGEYTVAIGSSSDDLRLEGDVLMVPGQSRAK